MIFRPAAAVVLAALLALVPAASTWAQQEGPAAPAGPTASPEPSETPLIPLPEPTEEEEPSPSAEPAPSADPEPSPTPEPTRAARPKPTGTATADATQEEPSPVVTEEAVESPAEPSPLTTSEPPEEAPAAAVPDPPSDPTERLIRWVLGLAVLLGLAGGAGLYWTREHP